MRLLPNIEEGPLNPCRDQGFLIGLKADLQLLNASYVAPKCLKPKVFHELSPADAPHARKFGEAELVLEVMGQEIIFEIDLFLKVFPENPLIT